LIVEEQREGVANAEFRDAWFLGLRVNPRFLTGMAPDMISAASSFSSSTKYQVEVVPRM